MNVLVAGATGNTGIRLVSELLDRGHTPVALVRKSSDTSGLPAGVELRQGDLTNLSRDVCDGCQAVIFAAGSGAGTSDEMTDRVDRDGAKSLIDIAAESGIERFILLSSAGAGDPDPDSEMGHYMQAKHDADEHLRSSTLSYAILRPVSLTDGDGKRGVLFGDDVSKDAEAAREDVAAVLARALDEDKWLGTVTLMQSRQGE